jgi:hypothetical protein
MNFKFGGIAVVVDLIVMALRFYSDQRCSSVNSACIEEFVVQVSSWKNWGRELCFFILVAYMFREKPAF